MFGFQLPVLAALGTSVAYLVVILISVRRRGFATWQHSIFILYLLLSMAWSVGRGLVVWRGLVPQAPQIGWEIAYAAIIVMPIVLTILTTLFFERPRVVWIAGIGVVVIIMVALIDNNVFQIQAALRHNLGIASSKDLLHTLRWLVWGIFSASAIALTVWDYAITRRPLHRNRILYWLIALLLIVAGEGLTLTPDPWYAQVGLAVRMMGVFCMAFTLISYYFPSLRNLVRKTMSTTLITLVTGAVYLLGLWLAAHSPLLAILPEAYVLIALGGAALVMAILTPPLRRWVQEVLEKVLLGGRYDPARALREYSAAISNILDLDTLVTIAIGIISEAMETRRGAFLILTEQENEPTSVKIISGMGEVKVTTAEFAPTSPILNYLRNGEQPLTHYEIDMLPQFRSAPLSERAWLQSLDMELYVPIRQQDVLIGVMALGERAGGAPYSRPDMNVLSTLADQTTVALQNARLVADLKTLNLQMTRLNQELKNINRRLEKLDAAKADFIQIASHELRTPLTQVRGYADMMSDMMQSGMPSSAQFLQISQGIGRATKRLEEIVTAMLDVSQIDIEALNLSRAPLAMTTVIRMAREPYDSGLAQRKQTLTITGLEGMPPVTGDLQRLCQAFGNIIVNCIKYTPDGGQITITGRSFQTLNNEGKEAQFVEVVIADTGIGIDPEDQELIFEKFYRVGSTSLHSTGTTKFMGAGPGLGLPIAQGIIHAHNGQIWVRSEGRDEKRCPGSQFHVVLPALQLDDV